MENGVPTTAWKLRLRRGRYEEHRGRQGQRRGRQGQRGRRGRQGHSRVRAMPSVQGEGQTPSQ